MKKVLITLCVVMMASASVFAGGDDTNNRYVLSKPYQNWFIDGAVTGSFFQSSDFVPRDFGVIHGPFVGGSAKLGKMVTPMLGFRLAYDYHPSKNHNEATVGYFSYKMAHFDMLFSPMDLLAGFNMDRFFRLYLYAGMGVMGYDVDGGKIFIDNNSALELGIDGGLINNFRINRSLDFHIDLQATITRWSFDEFNTAYPYRVHTDLEAMAGLTWYLGGRRFETVADFVPEATDCSEQEARINELQEQISNMQEMLDNAANHDGNDSQTLLLTDTIVRVVNGETVVVSYPFSIFFNVGSYELRDGRDRINLQEIAQVAINHDMKVNLRGTCDSGTASAAFNRTLAENRCNKIKDELVRIGVPAGNITIEAVGGVNELTPAEYDRRVLITFSK